MILNLNSERLSVRFKFGDSKTGRPFSFGELSPLRFSTSFPLVFEYIVIGTAVNL